MTNVQHILLIQLKYHRSIGHFEQEAESLIGPIKATPGLLWRMWISTPDNQTPGAVCFFESEQSLNAFIESPTSQQLRRHPTFSDVEITRYESNSPT